MKLIYKFKYSIFLILFFGIFSSGYCQTSSLQRESVLLLKKLEENHIKPLPLDENLSKEVIVNLLDQLDHDHLIFLKEDTEKIHALSKSLTEDLKGKSWVVFPKVCQMYKERLDESLEILDSLQLQSLKISKNELFDLTDTLNPLNNFHQATKWSKIIQHKALLQLASETFHQSKKGLNNTLEKEEEIVQKLILIKKRGIKKITEHSQGYEKYLGTLFLNSIISCYDAHSTYFSKTGWENFQGLLSTEQYSFGMELDENDYGDIFIKNIVPGGPAWNSNELHRSDVLLKVQWFGKEEIQLEGADLHEINSLLSESNYETLEITVRKKEGLTKSVKLKKAKIQNEGNIVKSYILNGRKKIGYISLPGFYSEWENAEGKGCANDVAKELYKLKRENIEGLILDVRYNGGGSLAEGLNLTGVFIDEGPLMILVGKDGKPQVIKDPNRGTAYDGPLVLMVNGQSASASEVLAATLQDYKRAVIVGSPTFGKATGQDIIPLENKYAKLSDFNSQYGLATISTIKIYRVTGKSAQMKGIMPDVILPDVFGLLPFQEAFLPNAFPNDSISKKLSLSYYKDLPLDTLRQNSRGRLSQISYFKDLDYHTQKYTLDDDTIQEVPLDVYSYQKHFKNYFGLQDFLNSPVAPSSDVYAIENTRYDSSLIDVDAYSKEVNEAFKLNIKEDIYIEESYQIISDLIELSK